MGYFAAHIKGLRTYAGLSQEQLALRVGVGITTIKNIESEYITSPPAALVEKLAMVFNTSAESLLGSMSLDVGERSKMVHIVHSVNCEKPFMEKERIVETVFVDRDQLRGYEYMGIVMPDNSMIDEHIVKGASVIVRQDAPVKNGDIVLAVFRGSEGIVRKYFSDGEETVFSACGNSELYPDIRFKTKEEFFIVGKVVRWINAVQD